MVSLTFFFSFKDFFLYYFYFVLETFILISILLLNSWTFIQTLFSPLYFLTYILYKQIICIIDWVIISSATTGKSLLQKKDKSALNPKFLNNLFDSSEDKLSRKSRQSRMLASVTSKRYFLFLTFFVSRFTTYQAFEMKGVSAVATAAFKTFIFSFYMVLVTFFQFFFSLLFFTTIFLFLRNIFLIIFWTNVLDKQIRWIIDWFIIFSGNESKSQVQRRDQPVFDDEFFDESFKLPEEKRSRQSSPSGMSASVTSKRYLFILFLTFFCKLISDLSSL